MNKKAIIDVVELGGTVVFDYKSSIDSWFSEIKIFKIENEYIIYPGWKQFSDSESAINYFMDEAFTSKNFGYVQKRLIKKGILNEDDKYENPSTKMKLAFEQEGRLVDEEFKSIL